MSDTAEPARIKLPATVAAEKTYLGQRRLCLRIDLFDLFDLFDKTRLRHKSATLEV